MKIFHSSYVQIKVYFCELDMLSKMGVNLKLRAQSL